MVKVERTFPAPKSLAVEAEKANGSYSEPDVIEQLRKDFHNKCYICELKDLQDPEELLRFRLKEDDVEVEAIDLKDESDVCTAQLIREVFNLRNTGMREYKSTKRLEELTKEMNKLYDTLEEIEKPPYSEFLQRKLKALLRKESAFAAFKRGFIRENKEKYCCLLM